MAEHAYNCLFIKEVGVVIERAAYLTATFAHKERQVKLGNLTFHLKRAQLQPVPLQLRHAGGNVLHDKHHLEERAAAEIA
jgi:hypothetical protein